MPGAPIRIAIVDDHALVRAGFRRLVAAAPDMEVVAEAGDAAAAIEVAAKWRPDVMLLDVSMPGGSGLSALPAIRASSPHTRVLVVTMHDDPSYLRAALASGAAGYMVKTSGESELVGAIRTVHGGRTYIDVAIDAQCAAGSQPKIQAVAALSGRERQVLEMVAYGHTHREIAERLSVSVKSIETYRARVADKLGLRTRADVVRYALEHGIMSPDRDPTKDA
ncbi:MAG: DNA-binding response regulator [Deltaproteobacteria bacterium]|nr:MAG: DNA-binding response regulator [Deltaproteobacteria bacterium]